MKYTILFLLIGLFSGCKERTHVHDIKLNKNQALYHITFHEADQKIESDWIRPHLSSLKGKHIRTKSIRGAIGDSLEVIRIVEFQESKNQLELDAENREVLDSLRKKISFNLAIRVGK